MEFMDISSIGYQDLVHGTGDWRNMQEVIRKTFSTLLRSMIAQSEQLAAQHQVIQTMQQDINRLHEKLAEKTSRKELQEAESSLLSDSSRRIMNLERECRNLKQSVMETRAHLNNKVSKEEFEDCRQRILAKCGSVSSKNLGVDKVDLDRVDREIRSLHSRIVESLTKSSHISLALNESNGQLNVIRKSLDDLRQQVLDRPTSQMIEKRLALKVH